MELWTSFKGGYAHFMIKEIEEQPEIIEKTLNVTQIKKECKFWWAIRRNKFT